MWFRVDDKFMKHPKVIAAAALLGGRRHIGRIAAVWLEAGLYACDQLTDGFVPAIVVEGFQADPYAKPTQVMDAAATSGLFGKTSRDGQVGYQFHEWHHYNPSAQDVKTKRARDRQRKGVAKESDANPRGTDEDSARKVHGILLESAEIPKGILDDSAAILRGVAVESARTKERSRARVPVPVPVPVPESEGQEQRVRAPHGPTDAQKVLGKLAHTVLDDADAGTVDARDVPEELKFRAAKAGLEYRGRRITKALDGASFQRGRRTR